MVAIARGEPVLRRRALYGVLSFASFSVLWTTLAFLLSGPPFGYSDGVIGLFGLVGAAGAITASRGRPVHRPRLGLLAHRRVGLAHAGRLRLPLAGARVAGAAPDRHPAPGRRLQGGLHLSNQSEIYRLRPEARNRINAFYMTSCFVGAAGGSALAAFAYDRWGWAGTCVLGGLVSIAAVARWATDRQRPLAERELVPEAPPPA